MLLTCDGVTNDCDPATHGPGDIDDIAVQLTLEDTIVGTKYRCRCPFHDDKQASAFFLRKQIDYGFLYCSSCDASWATEPRVMSYDVEIAALEKRLAELKGGGSEQAA